LSAVVNAVNLFDNMDGAASTMAAVICAAVQCWASWSETAGWRWRPSRSVGRCVGFLPHNLASPGARIFLGDGGSMPVGFAVAALAMVGASAAAPQWQALLIGLLLVGILALDTCLVVFSRTRRGISILTGGQDHLTHRTRVWLRTARAVAIALGSAQALISALALVAIEGGSGALVGATVLYIAGLGAVVALLESRASFQTATASSARNQPSDAAKRRLTVPSGRQSLLVLLGLVLGLGPFSGGYYDSGEWVPAGVVLVVLLVALLIAKPPRISLAGGLAVAGLTGLAAWTLLSMVWSESVEQAVVEGNRYAVYAALLGVLLALLRNTTDALWLLGSLAVSGVIVAATVLVWSLGDSPAALLRGGRLNEPLGYINGQATFFLVALFPCLALAEQRRSAPAAGLGMGLSALLVSLVVLSQSRGAALALIVTLILLVAVLPGRLRRAWALVVAGGAVALAAPSLLDVSGLGQAGDLDPSAMREVVLKVLVASLVAGLLWGGLSAGVRVLQRSQTGWLRTAATAVLLVGVVISLGLGISQSERVGDSIRTQYRAFTLSEPTGAPAPAADSSRLISGAGNRYDYWRVAATVWRERPWLGVGGGNFDVPYFARRTTTEDIRQPHSVQLQTLAETGVVGGLLLLVLLAGVTVGTLRSRVAARRSPSARFIAVAGLGAFSAWLIHTSVDWMHLLPGVTGMALAALATIVMSGAAPARTRPRIGVVVVVALLVGLAGLSLTRQGVAEHFRRTAEAALAERPAEALVAADRSLRLDDQAVETYYIKAAAFARYGEAEATRRTLLQAADREPSDFVTWTLLGDLAVRRGRLEEAERHYRRALALNPRNPSLQRSAADPGGALP
jgi:O-antigen ligase